MCPEDVSRWFSGWIGGGDSPVGVFPRVPTLFVIKFYKNGKLPNSQKDWRYEFFSDKTLIKWFLTSVKVLNNILGLGMGILNLVSRTFLPNFVRSCLILPDLYSFCCYFYHNSFQNYIIKQDISTKNIHWPSFLSLLTPWRMTYVITLSIIKIMQKSEKVPNSHTIEDMNFCRVKHMTYWHF